MQIRAEGGRDGRRGTHCDHPISRGGERHMINQGGYQRFISHTRHIVQPDNIKLQRTTVSNNSSNNSNNSNSNIKSFTSEESACVSVSKNWSSPGVLFSTRAFESGWSLNPVLTPSPPGVVTKALRSPPRVPSTSEFSPDTNRITRAQSKGERSPTTLTPYPPTSMS